MRWILVLLLAGGCRQVLGFDSPSVQSDASADTADAAADASVFAVAHLPPTAWDPGTLDLVIGDLRVDTTLLETTPDVTGLVLEAVPVDGGELAVMRVASLQVTDAGVVRVVGDRPLVVVASGDIAISGTIDAAAHGDAPGPGGSASNLGPNAGEPGGHDGLFLDAGGGGGGGGETGGSGGPAAYTDQNTQCGNQTLNSSVAAATPGTVAVDLDLVQLTAGSAGADGGSTCNPKPAGGAGGGAIQLSTPAGISIAGIVAAGGGGGAAGHGCGGLDGQGGGGGGAGGAIYLQSPSVTVSGAIVANGGGGGGGAGTNGASADGNDGRDDATQATGGQGGSIYGGHGGAGGVDGTGAADAGATPDCGNGGGGGGSVGRIVIDSTFSMVSGIASPAPR